MPSWTLHLTAAVALAFLTSATAQAQTGKSAAPPAVSADKSQADEIEHLVQPGDTIEGLAKAYLTSAKLWPVLAERNKIANPRRLQPGTVIMIPVRLQPQESATVEYVHGTVTARTPASETPIPVVQGSMLTEGTTIKAGPDAFVSVRLADGTVVRVQSQSEVDLRQLRRRGRTGSVQSSVEIRSGSVESTVPQTEGPASRFEVRTPRAVTSVRGTVFRVALDQSGQTLTSVDNGSVAVQSHQGAVSSRSPAALLAQGQGVVVSSSGGVGSARALLRAPTTGAVPQLLEDANFLIFNVPLVDGATGHFAQVARDSAFTQVVRTGKFEGDRMSWAAVDDGNYYLSVRAIDANGMPGLPAVVPFKVKARPVAPLYQQPTPGAIVAVGQGELQCTDMPSVRWYRIQIASDAKFSQPVRDEQQLTQCRLPLQGLGVGAYYWRVASVLQGADGKPDQGPFAQPQAFKVAERPATLSLDALKTKDGEPTVQLNWPGEPGQRFRLQLAPRSAPDFDKLSRTVELDEPQWSASDLRAGEYLARIQVLDPSGLQSDFSPARSLRVGTGFSTGSGLPVLSSDGEPVARP